jgi:hypothetical protein
LELCHTTEELHQWQAPADDRTLRFTGSAGSNLHYDPDPLGLKGNETINKYAVAEWSRLEDRKPAHALVANVDLVVTRFDDQVSVLYGRCAHRG